MEGLFHVHSNYSYDGVSSLSELVGFCEDRGYGFIILTEHAEDFNESRMQAYIRECDKYSNEKVLLIPGLEFGFEEYPNFHLLGIGIKTFITARDIVSTIEAIHAQNGLAVVAHPSRNGHFIPENIIDKIDGIEIWNAAYDSRYLPNNKSLGLYQKLKTKKESLIAFSGLDMHSVNNFRELTLSLNRTFSDSKELMDNLRHGRFINKGKLFGLRSSFNSSLLLYFAIIFGRILLKIMDYLYWAVVGLKRKVTH
jgi:hypothetical protein